MKKPVPIFVVLLLVTVFYVAVVSAADTAPISQKFSFVSAFDNFEATFHDTIEKVENFFETTVTPNYKFIKNSSWKYLFFSFWILVLLRIVATIFGKLFAAKPPVFVYTATRGTPEISEMNNNIRTLMNEINSMKIQAVQPDTQTPMGNLEDSLQKLRREFESLISLQSAFRKEILDSQQEIWKQITTIKSNMPDRRGGMPTTRSEDNSKFIEYIDDDNKSRGSVHSTHQEKKGPTPRNNGPIKFPISTLPPLIPKAGGAIQRKSRDALPKSLGNFDAEPVVPSLPTPPVAQPQPTQPPQPRQPPTINMLNSEEINRSRELDRQTEPIQDSNILSNRESPTLKWISPKASPKDTNIPRPLPTVENQGIVQETVTEDNSKKPNTRYSQPLVMDEIDQDTASKQTVDSAQKTTPKGGILHPIHKLPPANLKKIGGASFVPGNLPPVTKLPPLKATAPLVPLKKEEKHQSEQKPVVESQAVKDEIHADVKDPFLNEEELKAFHPELTKAAEENKPSEDAPVKVEEPAKAETLPKVEEPAKPVTEEATIATGEDKIHTETADIKGEGPAVKAPEPEKHEETKEGHKPAEKHENGIFMAPTIEDTDDTAPKDNFVSNDIVSNGHEAEKADDTLKASNLTKRPVVPFRPPVMKPGKMGPPPIVRKVMAPAQDASKKGGEPIKQSELKGGAVADI